ncbi:alpha-amylase family glycosyl hydrolase [Erysipelothrix sp. D19-032]
MKKLSLLLILVLLISGCASSQTSYVHPEVPSVYYEIFVASYYDSNGDGMGDLDGVREKLPYIQETLGISNVWFMPVMPSPSYHKYDVTDYKTIDPQYGDMESMKNLLTAMESRNMTLILDLVLNHTSIEHPWFTRAVACETDQHM